ncbi:Sec20-domain-containing protein [Protomyces lactucae-debilis]|uniref:Sec20-domain-containing protein n=1 Tax=Protomyces lactucae-debilis TaxID=2754530 RepID=A0A1Y2F8T8_PROLT|nr:Sec20-domain-containing protein [Protomyces lactucae-debilis]ORY80328.1 Sec20-domain-containing protein [Protomyces lactucae-debilis]
MDARLADLLSTSKQLSSIITRLSHCPGPTFVQKELADVIRDELASLDREIASCETYVQDTEDDTQRAAQQLAVAKLAEDLANHRLAYRRAVLKAQQNLQTTQQLDRDLLFGKAGKNTSSLMSRREERGSHAVLQASGDVTAELRRTHAMMSEELSRSALAQELLQGSSNSLKTLNEEYTAFETILAGSKRLIKELERADKMDRWLIVGALGFFIFVVSFILYKRIFSKGVNVIWWISPARDEL